MIQYTWKVESFLCVPQFEDKENMVVTVYWSVTATENTITRKATNATKINFDPDNPFVPFENLTEQIALSWVHNTIGEAKKSDIESVLAAQIEKEKNPPYVVMNPPWSPDSGNVDLTPWQEVL